MRPSGSGYGLPPLSGPQIYENAAWPIGQIGFDAGGNKPHDLVMEELPVTRMVFVPDRQVYCQPFQAPIRVGLHKLAHQLDIGRIFYFQQHDRQVAGDGISPKAGLAPTVLYEDTGVALQRSVGIDYRTGKTAIELCVGLRGRLAQQHLPMSPCQVKDAICKVAILVLTRRQAASRVSPTPVTISMVADSPRSRVTLSANGNDRIKHGSLATGKLPVNNPPPPLIDCGLATVFPRPRPHTIGFIGDGSDLSPTDDHQVHHPGCPLIFGPGPASAENRALPAYDLGLYKEIAERRVQLVRGRRGHNHFRVTGQVYRSSRLRTVGDADAAQFYVILGRNGDFR